MQFTAVAVHSGVFYMHTEQQRAAGAAGCNLKGSQNGSIFLSGMAEKLGFLPGCCEVLIRRR
jgi:hypothetical protein